MALATEPAAATLASATEPPRPWGFWATLVWTGVAGALWFALQVAAIAAYIAAFGPRDPAREIDAPMVGLVTIVGASVAVVVFVVAARLRGWSAKDYLALPWPARRHVLTGTATLVLFLPLLDVVTWLTGRDVVHPFIIQSYRDAQEAGALWLLVVAFVVAAPIVEEVTFRGFVFRGWAASRLGAVGAIVLASVLWAALHTQYEMFFLAQIFALGLLLGWIRWRSGSTLLTIALHALVNAAAFVQAALRTAGVL